MNDGHTREPERGAGKSVPAIDPAQYDRPEVRRMLVALDIGGLYRLLGQGGGLSQREIARRTGQSQSDVSDIVSGRRRVENIHLLRRIAGGLEIPPERMGLSWWGPDRSYWGPAGAYSGQGTVTNHLDGVEDEVLRRHLVALGAVSGFGVLIPGVGALADPYPAPGELPLPSRVRISHVAWVKETTQRVLALYRAHGGQAEVASAMATHFTRWMRVDATDAVRRSLRLALAEAHEIAGLCCFDSGHDRHARNHYRQALELAIETSDHHRAASALRRSGELEAMTGDPDHALKCYQLGQSALVRAAGNDPRTTVLASWLNWSSARAYARLNDHQQALACLSRSRDGWEPPDAFQRADFDWGTADAVWHRGRLDDAEPFAASAVQTFGTRDRRDGVKARLTLATIQVQAGEPRGLVLARQAINEVAALHSVPTRRRLDPLAKVLAARPGSDAKDLAHSAHQVAATWA
jgi:transcriptional regulator with XRE-family HTH domain/tetratricopeptide (TPR) repeat protein